jgi:hypothetical protein
MPKTGDTFITELKTAHLQWGSHRHTNSRGIVYGEGYLQIPSKIAYKLNITNNNVTLPSAEYDFSTSDGFIKKGKLLASGNQYRREYAKQFQGLGNLKLLGNWFISLRVKAGDRIQVDFISKSEILLTKL